MSAGHWPAPSIRHALPKRGMTSTEPTTDSATADAARRPPPGGVTRRAAFISLLVVAVTAPVIFYSEVVWFRPSAYFRGGELPAATPPAPWPLLVVWLLAALSTIPAFRRLRLTRTDLLTVYSVVLVVAPLSGIYLIFYLLSQIPSYYYLGRSQPLWEPTFLKLIPRWWGPSSFDAVESYFVGPSSVPWAEWALPLAAWSSFIICLYLANACFLVLLQKQWIQHERLTFPLAQIPLQAVGETSGGDGFARLPTNRVFWAGLIVAAAIGFLSELSQRMPSVPRMPMQITLIANQPVGPVAALGQVELWLFPWLISLAYMVPKDLLFTVWLLWLVRIGLSALTIAYGGEPMPADQWWSYDGFPAPFSQATGAVVGLAIWALWIARRHLARGLRIAFSRRVGGDQDEPLTYRWALIGLVACTAWMVAFLVLSGCRPMIGLAYIALLLGVYLAYARLQAEAPFDPFFWWFNDIAAVVVGMRNLLPAEVLTIYTLNWAGGSLPTKVFSSCTLNTLTSFKIADATGASPRRLTYLLFGAFVIALGLGMVLTLTASYHYGYLTTAAGKGETWTAWAVRDAGSMTFYDITSKADRNIGGVMYMAAGAALFVFFGLMRLRFLWWPFHPVGYLLANSLPQRVGVFPFFIAWIVKVLVTRYGGLRLYRATIPLAVGLIMGDVLNSSLWNLIGLITKGQF